MVLFVCKRCNYSTNIKSSMKNHLKRKNICPPLKEDIVDFDINDTIVEKEKRKNVCKYCKKEYHRTHIKKHEKTCKFKIINENIMDMLDSNMTKEDLNNICDTVNVTNNITNNITNNTININILPYSKTDINHLKKDLLEMIQNNDGLSFIPKLIERSHFDPKYPQNHNLLITNYRNSEMYYVDDDGNWKLTNKNDKIEEIIADKEKFVFRMERKLRY